MPTSWQVTDSGGDPIHIRVDARNEYHWRGGPTYPATLRARAALIAELPALLDAAQTVTDAYRAYGPVDDGQPTGQRFEAALDGLSGLVRALAALAAKTQE
jgi:hypothetical protein